MKDRTKYLLKLHQPDGNTIYICETIANDDIPKLMVKFDLTKAEDFLTFSGYEYELSDNYEYTITPCVL
jgi:hypothetical protein